MDGGGEVGSWRALRAIRCRGRRTGGRPGSGPPLRAGGGARDRRSCMLLHLRYSRFPRPRPRFKVAESPRSPRVQGCRFLRFKVVPRPDQGGRAARGGPGRGGALILLCTLYSTGVGGQYSTANTLYSTASTL